MYCSIVMLSISGRVGNALFSAGQVWELLFCDLSALQWQPYAFSRDERARVGGLSRYMGVALEEEARWATHSRRGCASAHPTASTSFVLRTRS